MSPCSADPQTVHSPLWIFGYGSLLWRTGFPWAERRPARVQGWTRRFWQGSTDHRGVPEAPGRVVTLIRDAAGCCQGLAYRIAPADVRTVLDQLDHRERGGYDRIEVDLDFGLPGRAEQTGATAPTAQMGPAGLMAGLMYVANGENRNYLGPAPLDRIAAQVREARGPSGENAEYVRRLADALRALGESDAHVFELEQLLRT